MECFGFAFSTNLCWRHIPFSCEKDILTRHLQVADACISTLGINVCSYVMTNNPIGVVLSDTSSGVSSSGYIKNPDGLINAAEKLIKDGITAIAIVTKFPNDLDCHDEFLIF